MPRKTPLRITVTALAGLGLAGGLAACSTPAAPDADADAAPGSTAEASTGTGSSGSASPGTSSGAEGSTGSTYADGTYTATGTYVSPGGQEAVVVTLTLENDIVTDLAVEGEADNPNTENYQGQFIDGIEAIVVGKAIDELQVDKVAGSSLTSGGFNAAIAQIQEEARA